MRSFLAFVLARTVSLIGSQITGFGLGVWLFQQTGSATVYGLVALATAGSMILVAPFTGVLIDRWDRRAALFSSYAGGAVCSVSLLVLHELDALRLSTVLLPLVITSCFSALHLPAVAASGSSAVAEPGSGRVRWLARCV